ncbi:MAG: CoA transferase, partial [Rhodothalassiaceae bacterium]
PALHAAIEAALAAAPVATWLERLEAAGIPSGPINDIAAVLADPQVAARNMVVTAVDPVAGALRMAGNPVKMSGAPDAPTRRPAPALDADRDRILAELGLAPDGA